ncbi:MAG TPA: histidinol dehydrogenase [Chloroflexus aurantiacus]|uniref:Histidinol dehydrogenase n=1 Tax=Chloroflexus aurantiacus (strain ATCC 29366 / DSM 635 / J-10-fl) TaxID=324602 RepID=A9WJJ5_CHLAA|nr:MULTISPECIES: histidinol dehydrogenase [Chloroflexus]ABY35899.1 Histidinol dehydrogenase [Chloroflexus aurantiacus J-10-fl]RMG49458.1 MAG: histidinol dehydrogenase [Chloroflexota bacterium]GIV91602.1 MAG: histidinol dehydrogenase [Chloroflexus sp.]HBW69233.1 histidinol dehydrogenase [Chloroflexus aurantiacus]
MTVPIIRDIDTARAGILRRMPLDDDAATTTAVAGIIAGVRQRGDAALREYTQRFDGVDRATLEIPRERWAAAAADLDPALRHALLLAIGEIRRFHERQLRNSWVEFSVEGALGQLVRPLDRVGLYVPGGAAPLPSSLIHAAVPARVAGVREIVVCSPPQRSTGEPAEVVMAAAHLAGVDRLFAVGGAQAIAALAYGTESVPRVETIAGPGNRYVIQAMRLVYGTVGIVSLPGPTETLIIADHTASPRAVAADLLAQAEHVEASAILLTPDPVLAEQVQVEVERQLATLPSPNAQAARDAVTRRGGIVIVPDLATAFMLANDYGPEHLCLLVADPWSYVGMVRNAGGIFLGEESFEVLGDYVAGPSHIMPTEGTARYASPVNVDSFRKIISLVGLNRSGLNRIGPAAMRLAEAEGLVAHAAAVKVRFESADTDGRE